jgi:twitching motility protein PilT
VSKEALALSEWKLEMWQDVIRAAAAVKASDVFWKPGTPPHAKIKGVVEMAPEGDSGPWPAMKPEDTEAIARSLMNDRAWERFLEFPEKDIGLSIEGVCRLRINIYRERGNVCGVMRIIPLDILTIDDLDMPPVLKDISMSPQGLVLVTGPTGCGKSTTLAAMIDHINRNRKANIITVEDPIEYVHRDRNSIVSQREVGIDTEDFQPALKYAMRQAPDVILIGEMRDTTTMAVAMQAAETGHLVFSTVHTTSAAETLERIVNMFPPHEKQQICMRLSRTLRAVISQSLVARKESQGRVAAMEIMVVTPTIQKFIEDGKPSEMYEAIVEGGHWGMMTKNQSLLYLYRDGFISADQAMFWAGNRTEMRQMIRRLDGERADAARKAAEAAEAEERLRRTRQRAAQQQAAAQAAQAAQEAQGDGSAPPPPPAGENG